MISIDLVILSPVVLISYTNLDKQNVVLGESHPSTLDTMNNLAVVSSKLQAQTEGKLE